MANNEKLSARIPIILDDLMNKQAHKDKELVFDYLEEDIYIRRGDSYVNITGSIRDTVEEIKDGSMIIHIVTEESLPAIKDREKNHWYLVVTKSEDYGTGNPIDSANSIYYGVINNEYYEDKSYLLIAQNMITDPSVVKLNVIEGYRACFYVPTQFEPTFTNDETGEIMQFYIQDRLYALTSDGTAVSYDVYVCDETDMGVVYIQVEFASIQWLTIKILTNDTNVEGLVFDKTEIKVVDGDPIGAIQDPTWTSYRYIFQGWSSKKAEFVPVDPLTYVPTDDMNLYAYFVYDGDMSKYEYKVIYKSTTSQQISTFYSVAAPGTIITPKDFNGYTTPTDSVELTTNGQNIEFVYEPIVYNISYNLNSGEHTTQVKTTYTIEDSYAPPTPHRNGYTFQRWSPRRINKGTTGNITFSAIWDANALFIESAQLRNAIISLYSDIANLAITIERSKEEPTEGYQNVSMTGDPIYMWYIPTTKVIKYYTPYNVLCNDDMAGVFENFTKLANISSLSEWEILPDTNISNMFKNCTMLAELAPLENWNLTGKNFDSAFEGTAAENAGRLPSWYLWDYTVRYVDPSDNLLLEEEFSKAPGSEFIPTPSIPISGHTVPTDTKKLTENNQLFIIVCTPT